MLQYFNLERRLTLKQIYLIFNFLLLILIITVLILGIKISNKLDNIDKFNQAIVTRHELLTRSQRDDMDQLARMLGVTDRLETRLQQLEAETSSQRSILDDMNSRATKIQPKKK